MIDFDREEFLQRLDLRIYVFSALLSTHEKYMLTNLPRKEFLEAQKSIDKYNEDLINQVHEIDERIVKHFDEMREEYKKYKERENGN